MNERIGFIGLGIMGRGMSHNLLKAGFEVGVWNRTATRMDALVDAGASHMVLPSVWRDRLGNLEATRRVNLSLATQASADGIVSGRTRRAIRSDREFQH
mgnify:CR=1 FL=1